MTTEKKSILTATNNAFLALQDLAEAWSDNAEGIDLNEVDNVLAAYPFPVSLDEFTNEFGNMACEVLKAVIAKRTASKRITYTIRKEWWSYDKKDFVDAEDLTDHVFTNLADAITCATELNRTEACCWEALPDVWETCSFCIVKCINGERSDIIIEAENLGFVPSKD